METVKIKELIMAKYGEIALKGQNKRTFEDILVRNMRKALNGLGEFGYTRMQSTIYVTPIVGSDNSDAPNLDLAVEALTKVFGLGAIQRCCVLPKDFDEIVKQGIPYLEKALRHAKTFKVEAKRADKTFPMKTPELQMEFGGAILEAYPHLTVDVHEPQVTVILEIRDKGAYLNPERITGAGGIPVGSSRRALLMLSGGLDSPVAAYMMAKRGVNIDAIHFQSPPYTSERALMKVEGLCEKLKPYLISIRLHCVQFTEVQEAIRDNCPEEYSTVILRRMMIKAANMLCASKPPDNSFGALITGESLGQVASQTLSAIACTDAAADLPVLRPLIGMDKIEIVRLARKINTYDISTEPYEDCCTIFTPKHPRTNPRLCDAEKIESLFDFYELVQEAVEKATITDF
jgi:thiamine biosynthesis protein ThiI